MYKKQVGIKPIRNVLYETRSQWLHIFIATLLKDISVAFIIE